MWNGELHSVTCSSNLSSYRCSSVGGNAILSYYFTDVGSYDQLNSAATNSSCSSQNGEQEYVQAWSRGNQRNRLCLHESIWGINNIDEEIINNVTN